MGDKAEARATMTRAGLPPIPGTDGVLPDLDAATLAAAQIGYPVLLKALAGGGGRGMRKAFRPDQLAAAWAEATAEASGAFGDGRLYMERLIEAGRHIELQVFGDGQRTWVLGERECSVQRRHQKLIEESPAPGLSRSRVEATAARVIAATQALGYRGAGTIEMLLDEQENLWFMEMNTRLQVEHTVTEMVTGLDLVELQLQVAANVPLRLDAPGSSFQPRGHAIECRINAEDPRAGFKPAPGRVSVYRPPAGEGIRVDSHLSEGDRISPHYDSMIAKVITWGADRPAALQRMREALQAFVIEGVPTTTALHLAVLDHPEFIAGAYDTRFLERALGGLLP
jgi:acetyl-CoA carboxylase biotin carboxylase subunit